MRGSNDANELQRRGVGPFPAAGSSDTIPITAQGRFQCMPREQTVVQRLSLAIRDRYNLMSCRS